MKAVIITIGNEILSGLTVDTNSAWLGKELALLGIPVVWKTSVGDVAGDITAAVESGLRRGELVICTGGLGPTSDDLTLEVLARHFKQKLAIDNKVLKSMTERFARRGVEMPACNRKQALVPVKGRALCNPQGTAPGIMFKVRNKNVFLLPGVPREVKAIWQEELKRILHQQAGRNYIVTTALRTTGIAESAIAQKLENLEQEIRQVRLAYLPHHTGVDVRITLRGGDRKRLVAESKKIGGRMGKLLGSFVYGRDDDTLEQVVGEMLALGKTTLALAESCTGGLIGDRITNVSGSSAYFYGGAVAYSNLAKQKLLKVKKPTLERYGAVSAQTAAEMARGARRAFGAKLGLAVTGIAGPTGGTAQKPVGLVFMAVDGPKGTIATHRIFLGQRRQIKEAAAQAALNLLRLYLLNKTQ
jgi:nicotinamide-nucleotide amidase